MTPKDFFDKVVEMRRCQKEYLKNKRQIDLRISKQIEREVDEEYFEAQEERFHRECFGEIKTERGTLVQTNLFDRE